ncbi:MAG: polymer-forming cytoskeletal protein [Bacteroidetes bacterium]|nr:polymer-forming cytoskeletal protein [Bacteroidota bacterium]
MSSGTSIKGELNTTGDIRIDGNVKGSVHSQAKVVLGENAKVEGNIYCQNADISGVIDGNIYVQELLTLKGTAKIGGDITTKKIVIEAGADFNGNCNMNGKAENATRELLRESSVSQS